MAIHDVVTLLLGASDNSEEETAASMDPGRFIGLQFVGSESENEVFLQTFAEMPFSRQDPEGGCSLGHGLGCRLGALAIWCMDWCNSPGRLFLLHAPAPSAVITAQ